MPSKVGRRLSKMRVELPSAPVFCAKSLPFVRHGKFVQLAAVGPIWNGCPTFVGKIGREFNLHQGRDAAQLCALNSIAMLKVACEGQLDRVRQISMVRGFVNSTDDFSDLACVIEGASAFLVSVFGEVIGGHARTAVGCASLPGDVAVELEILVLTDLPED